MSGFFKRLFGIFWTDDQERAPERPAAPVQRPVSDGEPDRFSIPRHWPEVNRDQGQAAVEMEDLRQRRLHMQARFARRLPVDKWVTSAMYTGFRFAPVQLSDVTAFAKLPPGDAVGLLGLASLNRSGYIRQVAVELLGEKQSPVAVPFVLLRLNDWVAPVESAAREALQKLLTPECVPAFIEHYRMVQRLALVMRTDGASDLQVIRQFLAQAVDEQALVGYLKTDDAERRLFLLQVMAKRADMKARVIELASLDPSVKIKCWSASESLGLHPEVSREQIQRMLSHPSAQLRLAALRAIPVQAVPWFEQELRELLVANAGSVRETAGFLLKKHLRIDAAPICRAAVEQTPFAQMTAGKIAGLAESGDRQDFDTLAKYADYPRAAVREWALKGMSRLDPERARVELVKRILDPSARVRRLVVTSLNQAPWEEVQALAWKLVEAGTDPGAHVGLVLLQRDRFSLCAGILRGIASDAPLAREFAWARMGVWSVEVRDKGWLKPSAGDRERIVRFARALKQTPVKVPEGAHWRYRVFLEQVGAALEETWIAEG